MAPSPVLITATFQGSTGLAHDRYVNTFAVANIDVEDAGIRLETFDALVDFYNVVSANGDNALGSYLSNAVSRAANDSVLRMYDLTGDLDGTPHGAPVDEAPFTLVAAQTENLLPHEVAMVLTLEAVGRAQAPVEVPDGADPGGAPDRPMQRRTGRIFVGPLADVALNPDDGRPAVGFAFDLRESARDLATSLLAVDPANESGWSVWSRADELLALVFSVSTDNAFDTQRRRGLDPTGRVRLTV